MNSSQRRVCCPRRADDRGHLRGSPASAHRREENAKIKDGEIPEGWDDAEAKAKRSQKDTDARWTKKDNETHYGYKNHINADQEHKLIQEYEVTHAAVHDSRVFEDLLESNGR